MRECRKERKSCVKMVVLAWSLISVTYSASCFSLASPGEDQPMPTPPSIEQRDPLQSFNRGMFYFNDKLDVYFLKPIATFYNKIVPTPINQGVHNVYNNINMVPTIANDILQLHLYDTVHDFWRLAVNTTLGIGGIFDVASRIGLEPHCNDFGLTLARYGWGSSTYIVIPFFGPSTIRDGIQIPVDYYAFSIYPYIEPTSTRYGVWGVGVVDRRAQLLKFESVMEEAALDRYVFVRNAYLQRRAYQIEQNINAGPPPRPDCAASKSTSINEGEQTSENDQTDAKSRFVAKNASYFENQHDANSRMPGVSYRAALKSRSTTRKHIASKAKSIEAGWYV